MEIALAQVGDRLREPAQVVAVERPAGLDEGFRGTDLVLP